MEVPKDLLYTKDHEWLRVDGDVATVGITAYAAGELGDVVFVELPAVGTQTKQMDPFGTIEAVKAVSDLYAPVSGQVIEVNEALSDKPEVVNSDPYGEGWMIKIKIADQGELKNLLSPEAYQAQIS
ncbi:MAG: glycine cleavage system protein GcvH [bacterium]|jgi:glycine cleavage system H protein|nr:glycine cleavage system protein GcvH [candidate division KSB1 bacterium]MDH7561065.1 glycine cleavage system protein GcvH [bacterium]